MLRRCDLFSSLLSLCLSFSLAVSLRLRGSICNTGRRVVEGQRVAIKDAFPPAQSGVRWPQVPGGGAPAQRPWEESGLSQRSRGQERGAGNRRTNGQEEVSECLETLGWLTEVNREVKLNTGKAGEFRRGEGRIPIPTRQLNQFDDLLIVAYYWSL